MFRAHARLVLAWCLIPLLSACGLLLPKPPQPRQSLPLTCAPRATEPCEGIGIVPPETLSADVAAAVAELSLKALTACAVRHDELRICVQRHNRKARP